MSIMGSRIKPCKGCPDRYPGCADHCEKEAFLEWKAEQEKIRENRRKYVSPAWMRQEPFDRRRGMK